MPSDFPSLSRRSFSAFLLLAVVLVLAFDWALAQTSSDTTAPTVTLTTPAHNTRVDTLSSLTGTTTDSGTNGGAASGVSQVRVYFKRSWVGYTEWWNGSAWTPTQTYLNATVTGVGTPSGTWSFTSLPGGDNLQRGRYNVSLRAVDVANQVSGETNAIIYVGANDTAPPQISVTAPEADSTYEPGALPTLVTGTVKDIESNGTLGSGLGYVQVRFTREWANQTWRDGAWHSTADRTFTASVTLEEPDANGVRRWSAVVPVPTAQADLPHGIYTYVVRAHDRWGRASEVKHPIRVLPIDTTAPVVSDLYPAPGASVSRLTGLSATLRDVDGPDGVPASGLSGAEVYLRRITEDGKSHYWGQSGKGWTAKVYGRLDPHGASGLETRWNATTTLPSGANLPPGTYTLLVAAKDRYNNLTTPAVESTFTVVEFNTRPVATAQSVSVTAGESASITLGATDANGEPITGYTITTPPTHGTLSGTAPNLVYTPAAGYVGSDSFVFSASDWEGAGESATVTLNVVAASSGGPNSYRPDALIAVLGGQLAHNDYYDSQAHAWEVDTTHQVVRSRARIGEAARYDLVIQNDGTLADALVVKTQGPTAGWTLQVFDEDGSDITASVQGNGWSSPSLPPGQSRSLRVRVTPTPSAAPDSIDFVVVTVSSATATTEKDVVSVETEIEEVAPPNDPNAVAPDLFARLDADAATVGENVSDDGTNSKLEQVVMAGQSHTFPVHLKHGASAAKSFVLRLPATLPSGWTAKLTHGSDDQDVTASAQSANGWTTPDLVPGATLDLKLTLSSPASGEPMCEVKLEAAASGDANKKDSVNFAVGAQKLVGLQWSLDDQTWTDVTPTTLLEVEQFTVIGVRAIKALPDADWPGERVLGPDWTWEGRSFVGEAVWLNATQVTNGASTTATAEFGSTFSVAVNVLPGDALIVYDTEEQTP